MSNVKNFGLIGVGSDLQFGKTGTRLINNAGTFNFKASNGTTDAALTAAGITSSGNLTLTTGNLALSATGGVVSIGGTNVLQRSANGVAQVSGTAGVVIPAGTTAQRGTGETGLVRMNTDVAGSHYVEFWDGDAWVSVATGGSTGTLQTEIDAIETSLGAGINGDGTFNANGFTDHTGVLVDPTSFTDAINQVAAAVASGNTLDEIFAPGAAGNVIYSDGTNWQQAAPGSTSGVQGYDAGLAALAAKTSTGIMVQTGNDTYDSRTLVAPAAGITISNADGVSGNPTFALANDLAAVEGLATNGFAVRTGDGTWTTRSVTGTAGRIVVTNGDGVASAPTIDLDTLTDTGTGSFVKITRDAYGRVEGTTAVVASDITGLVDGTYVNISGDTMDSGADLTFVDGGEVLGLPAVPSGPTAAASKAYVDSVAEGLSIKPAVEVVVVDDTSLGAFTYNNGASGVGATITANANGAFPTIDGVTLTSTTPGQNGVLVADGGSSGNLINGRYNLTQVGDGSNPWILTRCGLCDEADEIPGAYTFVKQGTTYAGSGWVQTWFGGAATGTVGTTAIVVDQFSGAGAYSAGTGLTLTGSEFSVNLGAGIGEFAANNVGIDLYNTSTGAIILTEDGTTRSSGNGSKLHLLLPAGAGLTQDATGLYVGAGQITNAMLANSTVSTDADTGTGTLALGGTLNIIGTATQGISTSVSGGTFTLTASDASSSQKGVASFDATEFTVTAGNVVLGTIPNDKLANSSITFTGTSGSDAVALGESMAIIGADSAITTTMGTNSLSIQLNTVDVAHGGTGNTTLTDTAILIGNGTSAVEHSAALTFNSATDVLTIGGATGMSVTAAGGDVTIASLDTNADIVLSPNGTGQVVVGPAGAGVISSDAGQTLTVTGATGLTLGATAGDVTLSLANNTTDKVTVSGPSAADYATNLADADLVNKKYVDDAIVSGAASGSIKAVKATVNIGTTGSTNIGAALPAGATIVRVKVQVTSADTGTGTLSVGVTGDVARYMTTGENDTQSTGIYVAETYYVNGSSEQVIATVASGAVSGSAVVFVEYQVA